MAGLRRRGVRAEPYRGPGIETARDEGVVVAPGNYPSKGTGELGAFFFDSEGNLIGIGLGAGDPRLTRTRVARARTAPGPCRLRRPATPSGGGAAGRRAMVGAGFEPAKD